MTTTYAGQPGERHLQLVKTIAALEEPELLSLAEEGLRRGLRVRFRSLGVQMAPTIADGEWLVVEPIAPVSVRQGDVVLALVDRTLCARRVIAVRERPQFESQEFAADFALRADARGSQIGVVGGHRILGRVVAVDRGDRLVSLDAAPEPRTKRITGLGIPLVIAAVAAAAAALIGVLPMVRSTDGAAATASLQQPGK